MTDRIDPWQAEAFDARPRPIREGREPMTTTVTCPACGHTETGDSYHPHDAMTEHYTTHRRALACGCQTGPNGQLWTCDDHTPAFLRERAAWRSRCSFSTIAMRT